MLKCLLLSIRAGTAPAEKPLKALNPLNSFHVISKYRSLDLAVNNMTFQISKCILSTNKRDTGNILEKTQTSARRDLPIHNYCMCESVKFSIH